jgi:hypothetical protein
VEPGNRLIEETGKQQEPDKVPNGHCPIDDGLPAET